MCEGGSHAYRRCESQKFQVVMSDILYSVRCAGLESGAGRSCGVVCGKRNLDSSHKNQERASERFFLVVVKKMKKMWEFLFFL